MGKAMSCRGWSTSLGTQARQQCTHTHIDTHARAHKTLGGCCNEGMKGVEMGIVMERDARDRDAVITKGTAVMAKGTGDLASVL